ncbi:DNA-binding protein [Protofrankia symbiont of Coriaria ruscifolia]|uniref:DNA-binding protein n=1 Tax=Protofrankia symbiont of Coriaria ruscifolia TaxID=1306542 RepID=UPI0010419395|nr:DNA-binding protein [Protofrankia symbiont of Coriaria ruscifolia]
MSQAESGRDVPSENLVAALERALDGAGELRTLREQARREQQAHRYGLPDPREVTDTDRREFVQSGALAAAAGMAAEVSRLIASADPDPLTLEEMEVDVDRIAATYMTTPHEVLTPRVLDGWRGAETALAGRVSLASRKRVTVLAGQYSYYLARLAFNTGDDVAARRFAVLASQYADDVGDPLLTGSVAGLRSSIAYYGGRFHMAAGLAAQARRSAHPYMRARLAAYEARARAATGDVDGARAALAAMTDAVFDSAPMFGEPPFDVEAVAGFTAVVAGRLGDGERAEAHARQSIAILETRNGYPEDYGNTLAALSVALLLRPRPEPEEAAAVAMRALDVVATFPTRTVVQRARDLSGLFAEHRELPPVVDFRERLATEAPRLMLTAGT